MVSFCNGAILYENYSTSPRLATCPGQLIYFLIHRSTTKINIKMYQKVSKRDNLVKLASFTASVSREANETIAPLSAVVHDEAVSKRKYSPQKTSHLTY